MSPAEIAAQLRENALNMKLGGTSDEPAAPFGLINEFRQGEAVITLAAFKTGDVSLYFSSGGGIIGGVGQPELAQLARSTIGELGAFLPQLERSDAADPPRAGEICFYVLTPTGRYTARALATDQVARDGAVARLVRLSGALLTKVREASAPGQRLTSPG